MPNYKVKMADNISFLAIPEGFKFKRLEKLVLVDTPSVELTDVFTDEIRSVVVIILPIFVSAFILGAAIAGKILWKRRKMVNHHVGDMESEQEGVELQERSHIQIDVSPMEEGLNIKLLKHVAAEN